jgi:putative membrane protein
VHWLVAAGVVAGAASVAPGFRIEGASALVSTALAIGAVNVAIRPLVSYLPFPVPLIALVLCYLILNGALLKAATLLVPGVAATGAGGPAIAALLVTIGSMLLFALAGRDERTRKG